MNKLKTAIRNAEVDGFTVYPNPDTAILQKLKNCKTRTELWKNLPNELAYNKQY